MGGSFGLCRDYRDSRTEGNSFSQKSVPVYVSVCNRREMNTPEHKAKNRERQKRFRENHKHEMTALRKKYLENEWRRKLGLEVKP